MEKYPCLGCEETIVTLRSKLFANFPSGALHMCPLAVEVYRERVKRMYKKRAGIKMLGERK
jgi:hypothetical protein